MSISTLLGIIVGFGLFILAIVIQTDHYTIFLSLTGLLFVLGGTIATAFISYQARYVRLAFIELGRLFDVQRINRAILREETGRIIEWGYLVKRKGIRALEEDIKSMKPSDPFLRFGIDMVLSGYPSDELREMLTNTVEATFERRTVPAEILQNMGNTAPAFGMIGTLVGLIIMLETLGSNPDKLGAGLAFALVTTLYGLFFSRLVFKPAANKLMQKEEIARFRNRLITEGFVCLAEQQSPRYIQDRMNSFLDPQIQYDINFEKRRGTI